MKSVQFQLHALLELAGFGVTVQAETLGAKQASTLHARHEKARCLTLYEDFMMARFLAAVNVAWHSDESRYARGERSRTRTFAPAILHLSKQTRASYHCVQHQLTM